MIWAWVARRLPRQLQEAAAQEVLERDLRSAIADTLAKRALAERTLADLSPSPSPAQVLYNRFKQEVIDVFRPQVNGQPMAARDRAALGLSDVPPLTPARSVASEGEPPDGPTRSGPTAS